MQLTVRVWFAARKAKSTLQLRSAFANAPIGAMFDVLCVSFQHGKERRSLTHQHESLLALLSSREISA